MRISDWISDVCSSDLALGVTLCRLFTGSFPYGEAEAFSRPRFGKPKPPSASRDDLPAWLDDIILRAVATSPNARFGDVVEMLHALEGGPVIAPARSEEHTSELQSLMRISYAVFCLKKKNKTRRTSTSEKYT